MRKERETLYDKTTGRPASNLEEIQSLSAQFVMVQHQALAALEGAPTPLRVNPCAIEGRSLWEICSRVQDAMLDAYSGVVDYALAIYRESHDATVGAMLTEAGHGMNIKRIDDYSNRKIA